MQPHKAFFVYLSSTSEVINAALEKAISEKIVQKVIKKGMSACEAFAKYGIM